jgi:hypothetical protein
MVAIREGGAAAVLMRCELKRLQLWVGTKASAMTRLQAGHQCVEETAYRSLWSVGTVAVDDEWITGAAAIREGVGPYAAG